MVPSEAQFRQRIHDLTQPFNVLRMGAEGALLAAEQGKATAEFLVERLQLIADQSDLAAGAIDSLRVMARR